MLNRRRSIMDNRMAVLLCRYEESQQPKPNAAVMAACDLFMTVTKTEMQRYGMKV